MSAADGYEIWAESYDRRITDVFAMQDEIAAAVVAALKVKLLPRERPAASRHRTSSMEAYDQYLLGRQLWGLASPDGYRRSAAAFEKAIALDPGYAAAYAGLSRLLARFQDFSDSAPEQEALRRRSLWAAEQAVLIDPTLAEAYSARANVRTFIAWDWAGAQSDFERALALDPGDPATYVHYGRLLAILGQLPQAIAVTTKGTDLDPLFGAGKNLLGNYLNAAGQLAEARSVLTRALEISPDNENARCFLSTTCLLEGNPREALAGLEPATTAFRRAMLAMAEHDLGHERESQRAIEELIAKHARTHPYRIAQAFAWRGERDAAFEWLERAYAQRFLVMFLKYDPLVTKLRDDPRYGAMLRRMSLPLGE